MCDNLKILNAIKLHKSDEGAIIQNTALSDQADKPHTNISLRIKQTGFSYDYMHWKFLIFIESTSFSLMMITRGGAVQFSKMVVTLLHSNH